MVDPRHVLVQPAGDFVTVTMNNPAKRNALSRDMLNELIAAFSDVGDSSALGVVLAANGPVFSAGHDFADVVDHDHASVRSLLETCTRLMTLLQQIPQPVVARVHALATAAGCQLVASADLAVAAESAGFSLPGGKGGWYCHTPSVAVARTVGRKRAMEMAMSGDVVDAHTAADWGLVNRVVPDAQLDTAVAGPARAGHPGQRAEQGTGQAGVLRAGRSRPAQGLRLRGRGDGGRQSVARCR